MRRIFVENARRKLRAKHLVDKVPNSRRYRLTPLGSICLLLLKLFGRIYGPLTAGILQPFSADSKLVDRTRRTELDRLYQQVVDDLDKLLCAADLKAAA